MISTQGLAALRIAATLVHGIPKMRMRIRGGDAVIADIGWSVGPMGHPSTTGLHGDPADAVMSAGLVLTPCGFRKAVTQAHRWHEQGRRMAFLDLPSGCDPAIDIGLPDGGVAFAGGIYRVPLDGRWLFAFATTLEASICRRLGAELVDDALPMEMLKALGVRGDEDTEVSIVYAETPAQIDEASHDRVIDLLQSMLARFTAHELISDLTGSEVPQP